MAPVTPSLFSLSSFSLARLSKERIRRRDKQARDRGANGSVFESAGMIAVIHYRLYKFLNTGELIFECKHFSRITFKVWTHLLF